MTAYNMTLWIQRQNSVLANGVIPDVWLSHQPPAGGCFIKYSLSGSNIGMITTTGIVDGVQADECINFQQSNRWILGSKRFSEISGIVAAAGLKGSSITLTATNSGGNQITWQTDEGPYAVSCRRRQSAAQVMKDIELGRVSPTLYYCQTDEDIEISEGERFTIDELEGLTLEVWSPYAQDMLAVSGPSKVRKDFYARQVSA